MTAATWPKVIVIPPGARMQWQALAAALADVEPPCASHPWLWHSHQPDEIEAACQSCSTCPAFAPCDAYATAAGEQLGVWAGVDRTVRGHAVQTETEAS